MYAVIHEGKVIGLCESPNYIRVKDGININTDRENAEGIAIGGTYYENAFAKEVDGGEYAFKNINEHTELLSANDDALTEIATLIDDNTNAIAEIAEMIAGLEV